MAVWCSGYYGTTGVGSIRVVSNYIDCPRRLRVAHEEFFDIAHYLRTVTITVEKCFSGVHVTTNLQSPGLLTGGQKVVSVNCLWVSQRDRVSYPQCFRESLSLTFMGKYMYK